eukprot:gnl/Trimastix_PCT/3885.p1 GENE.gnl/Trimastix_PCT/3885~~gnl/Trimastix_PCT/3885.p1  ORF type:complete len:435 (+),score=86.50 gnl/Trimastix_PCT/3885:90-1394(+)
MLFLFIVAILLFTLWAVGLVIYSLYLWRRRAERFPASSAEVPMDAHDPESGETDSQGFPLQPVFIDAPGVIQTFLEEKVGPERFDMTEWTYPQDNQTVLSAHTPTKTIFSNQERILWCEKDLRLWVNPSTFYLRKRYRIFWAYLAIGTLSLLFLSISVPCAFNVAAILFLVCYLSCGMGLIATLLPLFFHYTGCLTRASTHTCEYFYPAAFPTVPQNPTLRDPSETLERYFAVTTEGLVLAHFWGQHELGTLAKVDRAHLMRFPLQHLRIRRFGRHGALLGERVGTLPRVLYVLHTARIQGLVDLIRQVQHTARTQRLGLGAPDSRAAQMLMQGAAEIVGQGRTALPPAARQLCLHVGRLLAVWGTPDHGAEAREAQAVLATIVHNSSNPSVAVPPPSGPAGYPLPLIPGACGLGALEPMVPVACVASKDELCK